MIVRQRNVHYKQIHVKCHCIFPSVFYVYLQINFYFRERMTIDDALNHPWLNVSYLLFSNQ